MNPEIAQHFANLVVGGMLRGALKELGGSLSLVSRTADELSNAEKAAVADAVDSLIADLLKSESAVDEYIAAKKTP